MFFPPACRAALLIACLLALNTGPAAAAPIKIELNRFEPVGANCRATLVVQNTEPKPVDTLKIDLVMFDTGGIVAKRVLVDLGPIARSKTIVKLFDIAELTCERIGRVLLNDVPACGEGAPGTCLDAVVTSSRTPAPFDK